MLTREPSKALQEFVAHREIVITFIRTQLLDQGFEKIEAASMVARINLWGSRVVENLYKCITSDLDEQIIESIVAHDFNGLSRNDPHFVPKSSQFERN